MRRVRPLFLIAGASLTVAWLCFTGSASARHRSHASDETPGEFAYYLLSLSWSPAYCLSSPGSAECNGPRRYGLHRSRTMAAERTGMARELRCARRVCPTMSCRAMPDLMPARGLIYHEWSAHGSCSGLGPAEYFALVRRAASSVAIPRELENPTRAMERAARRRRCGISACQSPLSSPVGRGHLQRAERTAACAKCTSVWIAIWRRAPAPPGDSRRMPSAASDHPADSLASTRPAMLRLPGAGRCR